MEKVKLEDLKQIALQGLKHFADFCEEHQLRYYLAYGTLLGAVRHKGFIPWDDDIDVWMPREDYDRLVQTFTSEIGNDDWELVSFENNKDYYHDWAKLCHKHTVLIPSSFNNSQRNGIFIDIFPQDTTSTTTDRQQFLDIFNRIKHEHKMRIKYFFLSRDFDSRMKNSIKYCISKLMILICGNPRKYFFKYADQLRQTKAQDTTWYGAVNYIDTQKKEWFDETIKMEFEGMLFCVPKEYDKILTSRYGDYMSLPPESERVTNHVQTAYYKDSH